LRDAWEADGDKIAAFMIELISSNPDLRWSCVEVTQWK